VSFCAKPEDIASGSNAHDICDLLAETITRTTDQPARPAVFEQTKSGALFYRRRNTDDYS